MNTERKPVDVLAVIDAEIVTMIERGAKRCSPRHVALTNARAAVAELIEAACDPNVTGTCDKETRIRARQRLQRAIARVGGA